MKHAIIVADLLFKYQIKNKNNNKKKLIQIDTKLKRYLLNVC